MLLTDGLAGTAEKALAVLGERTGFAQQIVGGAAGDEGRFGATVVAAGETTGLDSVAAMHVFSEKSWGVGLGHGLKPASRKMQVSRARGNVVHEIDGRPAFEVYREHVTLTPAEAGPYLIGNELGIYLFDSLKRAREAHVVGGNSCAVRYFYEDGARPSRAICESIAGFWSRTLELTGATQVEYEHPACMAGGQPSCEFTFRWRG